jgi:pyruvate-formate lyase-activating enzyme
MPPQTRAPFSSPAETDLEAIARTLKPMAFPTRFAVELCADCNMACAMCHHPQMRRPKGVMPFELWRKCADEIAKEKSKTEVWFSFCGEPLLEPQLLVEMIRYGKSVGLKNININTNGMYLTPEVAQDLLEVGVDLIVIGIDGYSKETYEAIRIGGVRETLYENVEKLLVLRDAGHYDTDVMTQFIEMESNAHEFEDFRRHWHAHGASVKARKQLSWGGKFENDLQVPIEDRIPCPWAITMMHVFWDGRVPRCPGDTEGDEGVGNAWHESLGVLWARLNKYRALHIDHKFDQLPDRCHSCKDWMTGAANRIRPRAEA